jgi:hypothetical protein
VLAVSMDIVVLRSDIQNHDISSLGRTNSKGCEWPSRTQSGDSDGRNLKYGIGVLQLP